MLSPLPTPPTARQDGQARSAPPRAATGDDASRGAARGSRPTDGAVVLVVRGPVVAARGRRLPLRSQSDDDGAQAGTRRAGLSAAARATGDTDEPDGSGTDAAATALQHAHPAGPVHARARRPPYAGRDRDRLPLL